MQIVGGPLAHLEGGQMAVIAAVPASEGDPAV